MAEKPDNISRLVRISGRVQGVGYRAWAVREATTRGLAGWVRNRRDGSVEALFVGPEEAVAKMIEACRLGPRLAEVATVRVEIVTPGAPGASHFTQRPTE